MWQPISTAPRDGTIIDVWLLHEGYRVADAYWKRSKVTKKNPYGGSWWAPNHDYDGCDGPIGATLSHWMEIPAPPDNGEHNEG